MDLTLSGNALKTFGRAITSLARIGTELILEVTPSLLLLHTLNSSRSAYLSVSLLPSSFDCFSVPSSCPFHCSALVKSVAAILRTPPSALDRLSISLPSPDSPKLHFSLKCLSGATKTYRIACNADPELHHLSIDRSRLPTRIAVRPRDLVRLLGNFQSSLQEITVIATEQAVAPPEDGGEIGGKAVEMRSYVDPTKDDSDMALHTQLWIDPVEEFLQYTHLGDPVDVTFGVKELKAFISFCEGCEVDIELFFEKAGEPILMAPRFGIDGGSSSDFDATLVLATMLVSQLNEGNTTDSHPVVASHEQGACGMSSKRTHAGAPSIACDYPSNHTKIWSDLSGSAAKTSDGIRERHVQTDGNPSSTMQNNMERLHGMDFSNAVPVRENLPDNQQPMEIDGRAKHQGADVNRNHQSQHHPSNWVGAGDDGDDDEEDEDELYIQATPHYDD